MQIRQEFYRLKREKSQERERTYRHTGGQLSNFKSFPHFAQTFQSPTQIPKQQTNIFNYNIQQLNQNNNCGQVRDQSNSHRLLTKYKSIFGLQKEEPTSPTTKQSNGFNHLLSKLESRPIDKFSNDRQSQTRKLTPRKIDDIKPLTVRSPHFQSTGSLNHQQFSYRSPSRVKELLQQPIYTFQKGVSQQCNENQNKDFNQLKSHKLVPRQQFQTQQQAQIQPLHQFEFRIERLLDTEEKPQSQHRLSIEKFERMSDISCIKRNTFFLHNQEESYNCFKGDKMSSDLYNLFQSSHLNCIPLSKGDAAIKIQRAFRKYYERKQIKLLQQQERDVQTLESLLENYIKEVKNSSMAEGIMKLKHFIIRQVLKRTFASIKYAKFKKQVSKSFQEEKHQQIVIQEQKMVLNENNQQCIENPFSQVYSILGQVNQLIRQIHHKDEKEEQQTSNNVLTNTHYDSILSLETKKNIKKTALKQFINAGLQKENVLKDHSNRQQQVIKHQPPRKSRNSKEDFSFVNTISDCGLSTINSFNNRPMVGSKENLDPSTAGSSNQQTQHNLKQKLGFDYRNSYEKIKEKFLASKGSQGQMSFSPGRLPIMTPEFNSVINFSQ